MSKTNRWYFGFFLTVLCSGLSVLYAEESSPVAAPSQEVVASATDAASSEVEKAVQASQQEVRDPFSMAQGPEAPIMAPEAPRPEIVVDLQGIGFGSKDAYAVIGGDVFYKGDEKKGIKLLEVRRHEVDILVNGGRITVPLFPGDDLKKARDRAKAKGEMSNISGDQPSGVPSSSSRGEQTPL